MNAPAPVNTLERADMAKSTCQVDGCERPTLAKSLCSMHWQRQYKGSKATGPASTISVYGPEDVCTVEGCDLRPRGRGLCGTHWKRWQKYGDPTIVLQAPNGLGTLNRRGYRMLNKKGHPLSATHGFVLEHRVVLYDAIGPGEHPCHWCGRPVSWERSWPKDEDGLVVDHLDSVKLNNTPENLVASCQRCNYDRWLQNR